MAADTSEHVTGEGPAVRRDDTEQTIRMLLAEALDLPADRVASLPADTPLFGPPLGLGSLTGVRLLAAVQDRFGVDVAAEDLTLSSLQSIVTLSHFVRTH